MPERIKRRTYKLTFLFFVGLFVFQGLFVFFQTASADSWASTPEGRTPVNTSVQSSQDPTAQTNGGSTTSQASSTDEGCGWTGLLRSPISCAAKGILVGLRDMAGWLATGAASLFVWVVDPANITGPTGMLNKVSVYNLWKFIRDFFNLFFILILLFSAFATIFQIESFSIRKIFFNILLAALIINFSFPITRLLIDMTNVPMYYFLNIAVEGTSSGALKITESFLGASGISSVFMGDSQFPQLVMNVIFIFLFAISLLVLAVLMLIRVIALVLLVIFSPVGFAASLLPGTEKLGRDWWNYFWKYAFFGPSAALMLMVSVRFMNEIGKDGTFSSMIATGTGMSAGSFQSSAIAQITFLTIPIILIWTAIGMANSASIAGAGKVTGWGYGAARKVGGWSRKAVTVPVVGGAKWAGRKVEKKMAETRGLRWLSPTVLTTAVKNRAEEQKHKDEAAIKQGASRVQDQLNDKISRFVTVNPKRWFHKGIDATNHEFEEAQHQSAEERKHISDVSTNGDYVINELKDAIVNGQTNKADAALQLLAQNNDMNDMLINLGKQYGAKTDAEGKVIVSSENMLQVLPKILAAAGEKNADLLAQRMMVIGERATGSGNYAFGGMVQFDPEANNGHGKFEIAKPDQQAAWAAGKVKNLESQKRQTSLHPDSLFTRTASGFGDLNGKVAEEIIKTFTGGDVEQVNRSRDDVKEAIHQAYQRGGDSQFMNLYKQNEIFKQYVQTVVKMKRGIDYKAKMSTADFEKDNPAGIIWTPKMADAQQKTEEQRQKAKESARPGETISPGGIILESNVGGGARKST